MLTENQKKLFNPVVEILLTISTTIDRKLTKNDLVNMTSIKTYNTVHTHVDSLISMGLVETAKKGKYVMLSLTGKGNKVTEQIIVMFNVLK